MSTLGAMPPRSSTRSLKRRGPSSRAATSRSVQRSPTRASASPSAERRLGRSPPRVHRSRRPCAFLATVGNLQLASYSHLRGAMPEEIVAEEPGRDARVAQRVGPAVVGIGHGWGPGSGVVVGDGRVAHQRPQRPRRRGLVTFADGRTVTAPVAGVDSTATWPCSRSTPAPSSRSTGPATAGGRHRAGGVRPGQPRRAGAAGHAGPRLRRRAEFRGPRGRRSRAASSTPPPLRGARRAVQSSTSTGRFLGINTNRLSDGLLSSRSPPTPTCATGSSASGAGRARARADLGVALVPAGPRASATGGRSSRARRPAGPRGRRWQSRGPSGRRGRRPDRRRRRIGVDGLDALHSALDAVGEGTAFPSASSAAPRSWRSSVPFGSRRSREAG